MIHFLGFILSVAMLNRIVYQIIKSINRSVYALYKTMK